MLFVAVRESLPGPNRRFAATQRDARNEAEADGRRTRGVNPYCCGRVCAISAISFLTSALPKELKFSATMTNAPGPPMTLLR
jgi:hypothetical protein